MLGSYRRGQIQSLGQNGMGKYHSHLRRDCFQLQCPRWADVGPRQRASQQRGGHARHPSHHCLQMQRPRVLPRCSRLHTVLIEIQISWVWLVSENWLCQRHSLPYQVCFDEFFRIFYYVIWDFKHKSISVSDSEECAGWAYKAPDNFTIFFLNFFSSNFFRCERTSRPFTTDSRMEKRTR